MDARRRAAFHEAGHAVCAHRYHLPIERVTINDSGRGYTAYTRHFDWGEVEYRIVSVYAGPEAQRQEYGACIEDDAVLQRMSEQLGLSLSSSRLQTLRSVARSLVSVERQTIRVLAEELLCRGSMSGDDICILLA
jgi:hypothetical protein